MKALPTILMTGAFMLLASQATLADGHRHGGAWICTQGQDTRKVSVEYETNSTVPCRVKYQKPESLEYPWRAERETGYCEAKAAQLVERLRSFGWTCSTDEPAS